MGAEQAFEAETEWPDDEGSSSPGDGDALIIDIDGYEGPLDLLLALARTQKVDLAKISVLELSEQYLAFVHRARALRIELAADYLVMAAWLAYLKSRLLLPDPEPEEEPGAAEVAARLAFQLQRLQAMRDAADALMARKRLGIDIHARGAPEPVVVSTKTQYDDTLYDLLKAYAQLRQQEIAHQSYTVRRMPVLGLYEARQQLERLIGAELAGWGRLDSLISACLNVPEGWRSVMASSFSASLELVRDGVVELRQEHPFSPIYLRAQSERAERRDGPESDRSDTGITDSGVR